MTEDQLLDCLASLEVPAAKRLRAQRAEDKELQAGWRNAIAAASVHGRTNEGRRTLQTILTAVAHDGDGGSARPMTGKRKAELLGIQPATITAANQRARSLNHDLSPDAAIDQGTYWFHPRARRSDATHPEMVGLMKAFWHTDEVSRAIGNGKVLYRESKKKADAESHPRRQLTLRGGGEAAYPKFLDWGDYLNFKATWKSDRGENFQDPGRTVFLSTRCKCLTVPSRE